MPTSRTTPSELDEHEVEAEALAEGDIGADELEEPLDSTARAAPGGGGGRGGVSPEQASGAPIRGGNRVLSFLRASWAELQRVQWPDRRQVTQATAVVLGFVAIAGAYLGLADLWPRKSSNSSSSSVGRHRAESSSAATPLGALTECFAGTS